MLEGSLLPGESSAEPELLHESSNALTPQGKVIGFIPYRVLFGIAEPIHGRQSGSRAFVGPAGLVQAGAPIPSRSQRIAKHVERAALSVLGRGGAPARFHRLDQGPQTCQAPGRRRWSFGKPDGMKDLR